MRRALVATGLCLGAVLLGAAPAWAHALPQASDPAAGATVATPPTEVTITFGEPPDPKLSLLRVLDSSGADHSKGPTRVVAGHPDQLRVAVGPLGNGVYTVSWRTVSDVDGHLTAGTFAFGVGVTPTGTAASASLGSRAPRPTVVSVLSRWLLYAGLMVLVGGAFVGLWCLPEPPTRLTNLLGAGAVMAAAGAAGVLVDAERGAHLAWSGVLGSSIGHEFAWRAVPVVAAMTALALALGLPRRRRVLLGLTAAAALVAMWGDVESSHVAASRSWRTVRMMVQWGHFAAAGVWVGGLATLLVTITSVTGPARRKAAGRYSAAALVAVAVIAASGVQRALDEVGTWHHLLHAAFGQFVMVKIALLVILVGLGALNRYRALPGVGDSTRLLRAGGGAELVLIAGVLGATGILQGLAPPSSAAAGPAVKPIVLSGHDFATTVRVKLTVSPGTAGFNRFTLSAVDYDTSAPVRATATLTFTLPSRPDLGSSTLALAAAQPGLFTGQGPNLSIDGTWQVTVGLQEPTGGVELPFTLTTRTPPEKIVVQRNPGLPTLYTLQLAGGSVQTYLDPGHTGFNEFHVTFLGSGGNETRYDSLTVTAHPPGGAPAVALTVRRLDDVGHFVADLRGSVKGSYRFDIVGTPPTGTPIRATFTIPVT